MDERFIDVKNASFTYDADSDEAVPAVKKLSFSVKKGEHLAILGRNGSGKSTLARMLNALILPDQGEVWVIGKDTRLEDNVLEIRSALGMVFQNPDNQIVGTTVEEDVAFGPENLGMPREQMQQVVPQVLAQVGLSGFEKRQPSELSGGQKQKLAVAGILAMKPACIILDEATAMLDPKSRKELLDLVSRLQDERGLTLINVTHHMDEVLRADRVLVMSHGEKVLEGTPSEVFFRSDYVRRLGLDVPSYVQLAREITEALGLEPAEEDLDSPDSAFVYLSHILEETPSSELREAFAKLKAEEKEEKLPASSSEDLIIKVEGLSHAYNARRPDAVDAVKNLSFEVKKGEFLGISGHTGSGKSTLIQHLNGLLRPQEGTVRIMGFDASENKDIRELRRHVGMVFQYPEQQLFAETIYDDVAFGPRRLGMPEEEVRANCLEALRLAGLSHIELERSPFELSGGQMRRVAIAGILAMKPEVLILDEPAAGLDPRGREEIFQTLLELQAEGVTVLLVSHSMDDLARLADRILILNHGEMSAIAPVAEVFSDRDLVLRNDLDLPAVMLYTERFKTLYPDLDSRVFTPSAAALALLEAALKEQDGEAETAASETAVVSDSALENRSRRAKEDYEAFEHSEEVGL